LSAHTSNAERIARAAAESEAAVKEMAAKKAASLKPPRKPRAAPPPKRIKIVWAVGKTGAAPVKSFPYAERAAADAEALRIGKGCVVTPLKVPME
jgi:hypothetical protein